MFSQLAPVALRVMSIDELRVQQSLANLLRGTVLAAGEARVLGAPAVRVYIDYDDQSGRLEHTITVTQELPVFRPVDGLDCWAAPEGHELQRLARTNVMGQVGIDDWEAGRRYQLHLGARPAEWQCSFPPPAARLAAADSTAERAPTIEVQRGCVVDIAAVFPKRADVTCESSLAPFGLGRWQAVTAAALEQGLFALRAGAGEGRCSGHFSWTSDAPLQRLVVETVTPGTLGQVSPAALEDLIAEMGGSPYQPGSEFHFVELWGPALQSLKEAHIVATR